MLIAPGELPEGSQQGPSLLGLAALRQAVKVVQSEKMASEHRAAIAGYVSGKA